MSPPPIDPALPPPASTDPVAVQAQAWIAWLASGAVEETRMQAFEAWLALPGHRRAFEYERQLWRGLGPRPVAACAAAPRRHRRRRWSLAVAAMLALAWVAPEAWLRLQSDHRTTTAIAEVALPDGSRAVLDADSAIALHFDGKQRRVELLRGRAWFEVAPGHALRFDVTAQGGVVEDISTAFAVASEASGVQAEVEQGRIRVAAQEGGSWTALQLGQRAAFTRGGQVQRLDDVAPDRIAAWRQGELLLDAVDVADAVQRIGRYRRGPTFVRGDLSRLPVVNAAFRTDRPEQALDALAGSAGLRITRLPMGVAIVQADAKP